MGHGTGTAYCIVMGFEVPGSDIRLKDYDKYDNYISLHQRLKSLKYTKLLVNTSRVLKSAKIYC